MCGIFLKRGLFKDVKNDIPICQKRKYKKTSTQIHKHTNTAYDELMVSSNGRISETKNVTGACTQGACVRARLEKFEKYFLNQHLL